MRLSDVVAAGRTVVPLQSSTVAGAARELLGELAAAGLVADPEKLRLRVEEDRPEDIVAMGDRAFLLHYRSDAAAELIVALGTAPHPICRGSDGGDGQCARILLLVVAPPRQAALYLQVVGAFARLLSRPEVVEAVLAQPDGGALAQLPVFAETQLPEQLMVRDLMSARPVSVQADTPVREAALLMSRRALTALPVLGEDGRIIGLLSDRELIRHLLTNYLQGGSQGRGGGEAPPRLVRDIMTRQVLCVSPDQPLAEVASLMANKDVDRVPVVREGQLVGFLTRGDLVRKLLGS
ncbi:MAG TPA: CBS domain-containing protein [Gemmatimonadaceae bacterium]|nr:CBS domain-containing protein [Gemmatimonadaceae bacterium]